MTGLRRELRKHRLGLAVLCLLTVALVVWTCLDPWLRLGNADGDRLQSLRLAVLLPAFSPDLSLSALSSIGPVMLAIFGACVVGSEYRWGTVGGEVALTSRAEFARRKLALGAAAAAILVVLALATGMVGAVLATATADGRSGSAEPAPLPGGPVGLADLAAQVVLTWAGLLLWFSIAALVALVTRSSFVAVVGTVAYSYLEVFAAPAVSPALARVLPANVQVSTLQVFEYLPEASVVSAPVTRAVESLPLASLALAAYVALMAAALVVVSRRLEHR